METGSGTEQKFSSDPIGDLLYIFRSRFKYAFHPVNDGETSTPRHPLARNGRFVKTDSETIKGFRGDKIMLKLPESDPAASFDVTEYVGGLLAESGFEADWLAKTKILVFMKAASTNTESEFREDGVDLDLDVDSRIEATEQFFVQFHSESADVDDAFFVVDKNGIWQIPHDGELPIDIEQAYLELLAAEAEKENEADDPMMAAVERINQQHELAKRWAELLSYFNVATYQ